MFFTRYLTESVGVSGNQRAQAELPGAPSVRVSNSPAGLLKSLFDHVESVRGLEPGFDLCRPAGRGQPHHRTPGHAVGEDAAAAASAQLDRKHSRVSTHTHTQSQQQLISDASPRLQKEPCILC